VSFCLQDMLVGRPRDTYIPVPEENDRPPSHLAAPEIPTQVRLKHQWCFCVILLLGLVARGQASPDHYPYQPFRWVIRHLSSDNVLKEITTPNTPSFVFRITDLFPGQPTVDPYSPHATQMYLSYWCPASNPGKSYCNHPGWGCCGHWGYETIVTDARLSGPGWEPQEPDRFLQFTWAPTGCKTPLFFQGNFYRNSHKIPKFRKCTDYIMTVLQPDHPSWATGKTWTVVLQGSKERVNVQVIRLPASMSQSVIPNPVLVVSRPREGIATNGSSSRETQRSELVSPSDLLTEPTLSNPFINVLNATFISLNKSNPNFTESCWLCYDAQPPFYKGAAFDLPFIFSKSNNPRQCRWDTPRRGITLSQVTG
ncbi:ENV1 protein, partial [Loxia curvirostra]|nr:ENV1 protein [Loxia curvirostra]